MAHDRFDTCSEVLPFFPFGNLFFRPPQPQNIFPDGRPSTDVVVVTKSRCLTSDGEAYKSAEVR